jgi:hypothetical protein
MHARICIVHACSYLYRSCMLVFVLFMHACVATLLLPFSVNHSIRIAQDYMAKWELVWPKLLERSTLFEWKIFHQWLKCGDQEVCVNSIQL